MRARRELYWALWPLRHGRCSTENYEETMKSKMLVILSTLVMALGLMAQNATQTPAAPSGDDPKACACCNHDQAGGKMSCCGKDGKFGQMSKDGKDATMSHDEMMSKDGKSGMKCPMMAKNDGKDSKMSDRKSTRLNSSHL